MENERRVHLGNPQENIEENLGPKIPKRIYAGIAAGAVVAEIWDRRQRRRNGQSYTKESLLKSFAQGYKDIPAALAVALAGKGAGIKMGNSGLDRETAKRILEKPLRSALFLGLLAPMFEEAVFRLIPYTIASKKGKDIDWRVGVATSVLFGLAHNISRREDGSWKFNTDKVPLPQALGGIQLWKEMHEQGYINSVAKHVANNSIPTGVLLGTAIAYKYMPDDKKKELLDSFGKE